MTETLKTMDGFQMLAHDHADVLKGLTDFKATNNVLEKKRIMGMIIKELSVHAAIEEEVLYPMVREKMGSPIADKSLNAHQQLKQYLYQLEQADFEKDPNGYMSIFSQMETILKSHMHEEENTVFTELRTKLNAKEVEDMGRRLENAKKIAPTHPHPGAGTTEGFKAKMMDTVAAGVDKARDAMA